MTQQSDKNVPRKRRIPRKPSYDRLERAAFHHLERFACSENQLRKVLERKVRRAVRFHDVDEAQAQGWIDQVLAKMKRLALIDDEDFADMTARSMNRRGKAGRAIRWSLKQKGVDEAVADKALEELDDDLGSADMIAAITLVRKRKLGPLRPHEQRAELRDKDMGVLARSGFSLDLARRVLEADDEEALETMLDELG